MSAYDEIDLVCPKCHGSEIREATQYTGTTEVRCFIDKMTGSRHLDYPTGYTDIDWDSGQTDEDGGLMCFGCLWIGSIEDLVVEPDDNEDDDDEPGVPVGDVEIVIPKDLVDRITVGVDPVSALGELAKLIQERVR